MGKVIYFAGKVIYLAGKVIYLEGKVIYLAGEGQLGQVMGGTSRARTLEPEPMARTLRVRARTLEPEP